MVNTTDTRTIGRYAHPSRMTPQPVTVQREDWRAKANEPLFFFFDGQSFKGVTAHGTKGGALDPFSNYGMTGAIIRPGKLQQNDWDWARAAVQCEYAFRAVEMVASDISAIPHGVKRRSTGEIWPDHPLMEALGWARRTMHQDILGQWQKSLYVFGENYLYPIHNGFTLPGQSQPYYNGIQWLNPLVMEPVIQYSQLVGYDYTAYGMERLKPHEVVLDKVSSMFDDIRGQSRISTALESINITIQVKRFTLQSFINDLRAQGVITGRQGSNLQQQDINSVVELLKAQRESRLIGIPYQVEYTQIQHKWDDTQFKASEEALRAIAAALGIPLSVLGAWFSATYQSAPAQIEFYQNMVIFRECDRLKTYIDEVLMPYYDPYGEGEWFYDKDAAQSLTEDKVAKTNIVNSRQAAGNLTVNEARAKLGDAPIEGGDVLVLNGQLYTLAQLKQLSQQISAPLPPDPLTAAAPALPAGVEDKAVEPTEQPGMKSAFMGLTFPHHPDLIGLQNRVKQIVGEGQCTWNEPGDFHITLMNAPAITDEQLSELVAALDGIDVPDMNLPVGSLGVFDNVGQHAVHFAIRRNGDLIDLQAAVHEICTELGIPMSSFSNPAQYKPHITMGYATDKLSRMKYEGKLKVKPASFVLKSGDEMLYEKTLGDVPPPDPDPEPDPKPTIKAEELPAILQVAKRKFTRLTNGQTELEPLPEENALPPADPTIEQEGAPVDNPVEVLGDTLTPEPQTIEAEVLDELAAWQKKVKNAGAIKAADTFQNYLIRDEIAEGVRLALREAGEDKAAVKAVFDNARELISFKAIQSTRIDFEDAFSDLLADAMAGKVTRRQWTGRMRSMIETYGYKAYIDGLRDGGVDDDPDSDDSTTINGLVTAQGEYIRGLADKLFKDENTISTALADQKPAMWYNGSVKPFYSAGLLTADKNGMYTWVLGNTEEHCTTCKRLDGTKKRYKTWDKANLIAGTPGQATDCKGFKCECKLVRVAAKSSPGVLLDWLYYEHVHSEDPHEHLSLPTVGSEEGVADDHADHT